MNQSTRWQAVPMRAAKWLVLAGALMLGTAAVGQAVEIPATPTEISGTAVRMISYRHQDHMWQTSDGATHVLVNTGTQPNRDALRLYTSTDQGVTWVQTLGLPGSGYDATSDGVLQGNNLYVTYSTVSDGIGFARLRYDPASISWTRDPVETAFLSSDTIAMTPALARDTQGRFWVAFTSQDKATSTYSIRMLLRESDVSGWIDTGLVFGTPDSVSNERSARPLAVNGGITMVYTEHDKTYWAGRVDKWPTQMAWPSALIYTSTGADNDPYGSHFSVVADSAGNLHMASVDGGQLLYFRLLKGTKVWSKRTLSRSSIKATYVQAVVSGSTVVLMTNASTEVWVLQSTDGGNSWTRTHELTHDPANGQTDYSNPRMEAPSQSLSPMPVLQQYVDGSLQRAMSFRVPVLGSP